MLAISVVITWIVWKAPIVRTKVFGFARHVTSLVRYVIWGFHAVSVSWPIITLLVILNRGFAYQQICVYQE